MKKFNILKVTALLMAAGVLCLTTACGSKKEEKTADQTAAAVSEEAKAAEAGKSEDAAKASASEATPSQHEPARITEGANYDAEKIAGCYFDRGTFESDDEIDGGVFYCVVLRENGDAYISMQDEGSGTWDESGVIKIKDWGEDSAMNFTTDGQILKFDDSIVIYERTPDDMIPEEIKKYMETGIVPRKS